VVGYLRRHWSEAGCGKAGARFLVTLGFYLVHAAVYFPWPVAWWNYALELEMERDYAGNWERVS